MRISLLAFILLLTCCGTPSRVAIPEGATEHKEMWKSGSLKSRHYTTQDESGEINKNGRYEAWHESGARHIRGQYQNNLKHGTWYYYLDSGKKEKTVYFDKGEPKRTILPSPNTGHYPHHFRHHHLHHPHW